MRFPPALWLVLALVLPAPAQAAPAFLKDMVRIPAGSYLPLYAGGGEDPACHVKAFELDRYPVTNTDYLAFVKANPPWRRSAVKAVFAERRWEGDRRTLFQLSWA